MKKPDGIPKDKVVALRKKEIADAMGKECAALIVIVLEYQDNGAAWEKLFVLCNKGLVRYADSFFHDIELSEICVGEAWDKMDGVFRAGNYKELFKFTGLMNTIIRNLYLASLPTEDGFAISAEDAQFNFELTDEQKEVKEEHLAFLVHARTLLSKKDQRLVTLFFDKGKTHGEIAEILGMNKGSVQRALLRIVEKLKGLKR